MSVWTDNADTFTTRDREGAATLVLEVAVQEAIENLRADRPFAARLVLARAASSADRMLGRRP